MGTPVEYPMPRSWAFKLPSTAGAGYLVRVAGMSPYSDAAVIEPGSYNLSASWDGSESLTLTVALWDKTLLWTKIIRLIPAGTFGIARSVSIPIATDTDLLLQAKPGTSVRSQLEVDASRLSVMEFPVPFAT